MESVTFDESKIDHLILIQSEKSFIKIHSLPTDPSILICTDTHNFIKNFKRLAEQSQTIILHCYPHTLEKTLCIAKDSLLKRCIWYTWGGDFSRTKNSTLSYVLRVLSRQKSLAEKFVQNIHGVACWNRSDLTLIKSIYRSKAKMYLAKYAGETEMNEAFNLNIKKPISPIRCLVGNNAKSTNNHLMLLESLSKFKDEDIEIYVPLSYPSGGQEYKNKVCELGTRLFGSKFIPLTDYLEKLEYDKMLHTMSVGVFYQNRQQGGYNMVQLLMSGAKLYLNPESAPAKHFNETGTKTFSSLDIIGETFDSFVYLNEGIKYKNRDIIKYEYSLEYNDAHWFKIIHRE
mgnify:CR=1 FL=1